MLKRIFPLFFVFLSITALGTEGDKTEISPPVVYSGNLQIILLPHSIERIFSSEEPWENKALNYFNVLPTDTNWAMWYYSFAKGEMDYQGTINLAYSQDGKIWTRPYFCEANNILLRRDSVAGFAENCVFFDSFSCTYKMICSRNLPIGIRTFLYSSHDGISWEFQKQLFDLMQDSQASIVQRHDQYYVFVRYRYDEGKPTFQRAIGLGILDKEFNIIQEPQLCVRPDFSEDYNHIYNSAAARFDNSNIFLFPTYYNAKNNAIRIKILHFDSIEHISVVDENINEFLFPQKNISWAIVSPGLFPTNEKDEYWLYYWGTENFKHDDFDKVDNIPISYYRIKILISSRK